MVVSHQSLQTLQGHSTESGWLAQSRTPQLKQGFRRKCHRHEEKSFAVTWVIFTA